MQWFLTGAAGSLRARVDSLSRGKVWPDIARQCLFLSLLVIPFSVRAQMRIAETMRFGWGLGNPTNPAAGPALIVTSTHLIAGDQEHAKPVDEFKGRVYVWTNNQGSWVLSQQLVDNGTNEDAGWFGYCLGLSGDWLAVGSTHSDPAVAYGMEGDVQMFKLTNNIFQFAQYLRPTNHSEMGDDEFGEALAIDGDWMIVAAPWYDYGQSNDGVTNDTDTGAVWFYQNVSGTWTKRQGPVVGNDTGFMNNLGVAVELSGTNAFVYSQYANLLYAAGKVYWFTYNGSVWSQAGIIQPAGGPVDRETFGVRMECDGQWLVIAAPMRESTLDLGRVYFFELEGGAWVQRQAFFPLDISPRSQYGLGLSYHYPLAVVAARHQDWNGVVAGHVVAKGVAHIYRHDGTSWSRDDVLAPVSREMGDWFGSDVWTDGTNVWANSPGAYRDGNKTNVLQQFVPTTLEFTFSQKAPGGLWLEWTDLNSHARNYTVLQKTNPATTNWFPATGVAWPIGTNRVLLPNAPTAPVNFFRVTAE